MSDSDNPYVTEYPNLANIDSVNSDKVDGCDVSTDNEMYPVSDYLVPTQKAVYDFVTGREEGGIVLGNMVYSGLDTATQLSLSYSASTRGVTVTYSTGFNVWIQGTAHPKSSTQTVTHDDVTDTYYFYYNSEGVFTVSTTEPDFEDNVRVCSVAYVAGTATRSAAGTKTDTLDAITFCSGQIKDEIERLDDLIDVLEADKADDDAVVHDTGNETVAGVKTFTSFPITPSSAPTTDYQVTNKKYVDDLAEVPSAVDSAMIGEVKMWSSPTLPSITGATFMWADGSAISRTTYSGAAAKWIITAGAVVFSDDTELLATFVAHGLSTTAGISFSTTGSLPTGISADTTYYARYVSADTFKIATTKDNALAATATSCIAYTDTGTSCSLIYCPHGIKDATDMYLPDYEGYVLQGAGQATINARAKDFLSMGAEIEDRDQQVTGVVKDVFIVPTTTTGCFSIADSSGTRDSAGSGLDRQDLTFNNANSTSPHTARVGAYSRETKKAINYIVRVL